MNMTDLQKEKIEVERLGLGMFISELDRPWIESPFMLQGFVLDDPADLDTLKSLCKFVYVDRTRSIGAEFIAPPKQDVSIKRDKVVVKVKMPTGDIPPSIKRAHKGEKISFMDILRDLKNQQAPAQNAEKTSSDGVMYNVRHGADTSTQTSSRPPEKPASKSAQSSPKGFFGSLGGAVSGLFGRSEKLKSKVSGAPNEDSRKPSGGDGGSSMLIFEEESPVEEEIAKIYPVYAQSQVATRDIFDAVANQQEVDITAVSEILDNMVESIGRTPDALMWLARLKQTDDQAYNHALNVSITLMAFGNFLALSKKEIKDLGFAGLMQDVGKVRLSADIMLKKEKLTHEEFEYAKKHVEESLKILESTADVNQEILSLVAKHHERVDGSGYPHHLHEAELSIPAQATGLIDTYCAITSHKSYAKTSYHQKALEEIFSLSGKQFSQHLVDQLVQFMGMYPVSSLVELNTGEIGVVVQQNQVRRLLPRIMLMLAPDKERYESPIMLNLINGPTTPEGDPYRIVKGLAPNSYGLNASDFFA